jgi:hypothetical protein
MQRRSAVLEIEFNEVLEDLRSFKAIQRLNIGTVNCVSFEIFKKVLVVIRTAGLQPRSRNV